MLDEDALFFYFSLAEDRPPKTRLVLRSVKFSERNPVLTLRSVKIFTQRNRENSLNAIHCLRCEAWKFGYTRQMATLDAPKLLVLTLTVTLTLTDTVTVIFYTRISLTPIKRFIGGPLFPFSDFLPIC